MAAHPVKVRKDDDSGDTVEWLGDPNGHAHVVAHAHAEGGHIHFKATISAS